MIEHLRNIGHRRRVGSIYDNLLDSSVEVPIGNKEGCGFGHIIIPHDMPRNEYIDLVYRTGLCMIVTSYNYVMNDVMIPKHIIDDLEFPEDFRERGQVVSWISMPKNNQVMLTGLVISPEEVYSGDEFSRVKSINRSGKTLNITSRVDNKAVHHSIGITNTSNEDGKIMIHATGELHTSYVKVNANGTTEVYSDIETLIKSHDNITLTTGNESDENISTLKISSQGIFEYTDFNGNHLKIEEGRVVMECSEGEILHGGGATEWTIKGETTKTELEKLSARVDLLYQAIQAGVPAAGSADGGAAYKASMVGILSAALSESWGAILSQKNKVE